MSQELGGFFFLENMIQTISLVLGSARIILNQLVLILLE